MLRRSVVEEHENHERWLISYADFITLLFAFFVVMYSISQVNEGKYRVMSESLETAFSTKTKQMDPNFIGDNQRAVNEGMAIESRLDPPGEPLLVEETQDGETSILPELEKTIKSKLNALVEGGFVSIKRSDDWLEIDMKSGLLFPSGSARINEGARVLIEELGQLLTDNQQLVRVRGYTDNLPIENEFFSSNWELSSARAGQVVRILQELGISPRRMAIEGFGEHQPIDSNNTAEGRARNRRVVLAIAKEALPDAELAENDDQSSEEIDSVEDTAAQTDQPAAASEQEVQYEIIRTETGGLLIRAKSSDAEGGE